MEIEKLTMEIISWALNAVISALAFLLWHKLKAVEEKSDKTTAELASFKTHVAEHYSQKKDLEEMERRINDQLTNLGNRLEQGLNRIYDQLLKK